MEHEPEMEIATDKRSSKLLEDQLGPGPGDQSLIPLCQRLVAALISEEDCNRRYEDLKCNEFEMDGELEANSLNDQSLLSFQFAGPTALVGYRITGKAEQDQPERNIVGILNMGMNSSFGHSPNGLHSDESLMPRMACSEFQYENLQINEKILLELQSIDIFPEPVVSCFYNNIVCTFFFLMSGLGNYLDSFVIICLILSNVWFLIIQHHGISVLEASNVLHPAL